MVAEAKTIPFAEYLTWPGVNYSTLKHMVRSPLHYKYALENPAEETMSMVIGDAFHAAALEPARFAAEYVAFDGDRRAGNRWKEFQEAHASKTILRADELATVKAMAKAVREHPVARSYLTAPGAMVERSITWRDATGIMCKARLDLVSTVVADLKSAATIDERAFRAQAAKLGYFSQLAFYRRGLRALTKLTLPCLIIAVESEAPYDVGVFPIPEEALTLADAQITKLLTRVAECRASGQWPGRYPTEKQLTMPAWAVEQENNDSWEAY